MKLALTLTLTLATGAVSMGCSALYPDTRAADAPSPDLVEHRIVVGDAQRVVRVRLGDDLYAVFLEIAAQDIGCVPRETRARDFNGGDSIVVDGCGKHAQYVRFVGEAAPYSQTTRFVPIGRGDIAAYTQGLDEILFSRPCHSAFDTMSCLADWSTLNAQGAHDLGCPASDVIVRFDPKRAWNKVASVEGCGKRAAYLHGDGVHEYLIVSRVSLGGQAIVVAPPAVPRAVQAGWREEESAAGY